MKRFNPDSSNLQKMPDKGFNNLVQEFYDRIGQRFPVKWVIHNGVRIPEIKPEKLPENVTMSDIENVLQNMKAEGWF